MSNIDCNHILVYFNSDIKVPGNTVTAGTDIIRVWTDVIHRLGYLYVLPR